MEQLVTQSPYSHHVRVSQPQLLFTLLFIV